METVKKQQVFVGLDIGGTLAKLCIWCPKGIKFKLDNIESLTAKFEKGDLTFNKFNVTEIESLFELLKKLKDQYDFGQMFVTGGGAFKFVEKLKEIDHEYIKDGELSSLLKGLNFIMENVPNSRFHYRDETGHIYIDKKPDYPFLLVNIGSGVSVVKFTSKDTYTRVGGTTLGGGTFLGLSTLVTGSSDFDELLEIAKKGKIENTDLLIRDIYHGQDSPHSNLTSDSLAISLGKLSMDHLRKKKEFKKEDMVKSFLFMVTFNISQLAYYVAKNHEINQVYFAGNFIRNHTDTMECISYSLQYFSLMDGEKINAIFMKHDGFLGAVGCVLEAVNKGDVKIAE